MDRNAILSKIKSKYEGKDQESIQSSTTPGPGYQWESDNFIIKETRSVTMNTFRKKSFLFKSFVKIELSYVFTINMFSTAENCMEK